MRRELHKIPTRGTANANDDKETPALPHCHLENHLDRNIVRDAGAAAAAADDEDEEALPEEEENRPILPYSSFFILSSTNP